MLESSRQGDKTHVCVCVLHERREKRKVQEVGIRVEFNGFIFDVRVVLCNDELIARELQRVLSVRDVIIFVQCRHDYAVLSYDAMIKFARRSRRQGFRSLT